MKSKEDGRYISKFESLPGPPDFFHAIFRYNIWNTGPDINFDRIAHLAKLVFNTKGVMIALVDGGEV
jgi:hypothetical protein